MKKIIKALKVLQQYKQQPHVSLTDEQLQSLRDFPGFGHNKDILLLGSDVEPEIVRLIAQLLANIYPDTYDIVIRQVTASTLSAFYTPPQIVSAIAEAIAETGVQINSFLDPSAGVGAFLPVAPPHAEKILFEKDILTADILRILTAHDPTVTVHSVPFENIGKLMQRKFDLIASNIPFGNYRVFDSSFHKAGGALRMSQNRIHNYFFAKAATLLNEGGILAFITTQATCDTPDNLFLRQHLVQSMHLMSAVRLPHNLFDCGVGTDLLIFQKDSNKTTQSLREQQFTSLTEEEGVTISSLFAYDGVGHILATDGRVAKDRYGKLYKRFIFNSEKL